MKTSRYVLDRATRYACSEIGMIETVDGEYVCLEDVIKIMDEVLNRDEPCTAVSEVID